MRITKNEKGIALVVSLVMLILLSVLGTYALSTSTTELFISGNYKNSQCAFYAAEAGIGLGQQIYYDPSKLVPGTDQSCYPPPPAGKKCTDPGGKLYTDPPMVIADTQRAAINITWVRTGSPPGGYADDEYVADYFVITSRGFCNNASAELESMVVRMRSTEG